MVPQHRRLELRLILSFECVCDRVTVSRLYPLSPDVHTRFCCIQGSQWECVLVGGCTISSRINTRCVAVPERIQVSIRSLLGRTHDARDLVVGSVQILHTCSS